MSYTVTLYMNQSGDDYLTKTLTAGASFSCDFKQPVDVENPTIFVSGGASYDKYNYACIPEFNRYYWMKPVAGNGNTMTFNCQSDPLMSFRDQIKACPAVISRNPWHFDLYVPDPKLPLEARTASAVIKFPNVTAFDGNSNCYILTCLGSGVQVPAPTP